MRATASRYELAGHPLVTAKPLTAADAHRMAKEYFEHWLPLADRAQSLSRASVENGVPTDVAFMLHQTTERLYICFLLVRTLYSHARITSKLPRSLAEDKEARLIAA